MSLNRDREPVEVDFVSHPGPPYVRLRIEPCKKRLAFPWNWRKAKT